MMAPDDAHELFSRSDWRSKKGKFTITVITVYSGLDTLSLEDTLLLACLLGTHGACFMTDAIF